MYYYNQNRKLFLFWLFLYFEESFVETEERDDMVIFVTDEGRYWNHKNPILEKYVDCVVVVCLNGEKVTDKYRCVKI